MNTAIDSFVHGSLTPSTILAWTAIAFVLAAAGGGMGGLRLAGKDLGPKLAALIGAMFGPVATAPAVLAALVVLALLAH
jgi:hypothetical protein